MRRSPPPPRILPRSGYYPRAATPLQGLIFWTTLQGVGEKRRDFFISYTSTDRAWAEWIAWELEAAGYTTLIQAWDFRPGTDWAVKMQEGTAEWNRILAVLSPGFCKSKFTSAEWTSAFAKDPTGELGLLVPVRVAECEPPGLLRARTYIDLVGLGEDTGREKLLEGVRQGRAKPAEAPVFPPSAKVKPEFPLILAETRAAALCLPPEPQDFVGRAEALEALDAMLVQRSGRALLYGEPGCGKSTLALKFSWQTQGAFDAVAFQACGQRAVAGIAADLAVKLKLGVETRPAEEQIDAAKMWLAQRRALLVLDDVWDDDVRALAAGPPVSLLCTSRRRALSWVSTAHSLEVTGFSPDEAQSIFRLCLKETAEQHRDALLGFAERVERLPIAIVVGTDLLRRELDPVPEAARGLRLERLRNEVYDVAELLRRAITARPERERRLLEAMAVCVPEGFWLPLPVQMAGLSETEGREARDRLFGSSLLRVLDRDRQRFQLHGLLREQLRALAPVGELQAAHAGVLEALFRDWKGRRRECRECLSEVIPAVQHLRGKNEGGRAARLSYWGFKSGRRVGELEMAFRIIQQEEALCREVDDKTGLQASYGHQATVLQTWGRLEEALALLKKQETLCWELGHKDGVQASYGHQATILHAWGRLEEALALLKKQEALCRELDAKDGLQWSYSHQAAVLRSWHRLEDAWVLLKKQEALCREASNKDGLRWSYAQQAVILHAWGRSPEALAVLQKQEALCREVDNQDGLQENYSNQAAILGAWGRLEEAVALRKKQEALCRELGNRNALAFCYWQWGLLARQRRDRPAEREKLTDALKIFTELGMSQERGAVQAELDKANATDGGKAG